MPDPTILVALFAGLASFVAPCILPIIPAFLAYISGTTLTEIGSKQESNFKINKINILLNTIFFVLGFSVIFSRQRFEYQASNFSRQMGLRG
jgi:cytochrome c-type biogenesis protein